ncbi:5743_t:CDS:2 [Cetraspora pellucida]|uniref:5743_t:CDS:1 n=1 Tax=Cetraspora pellucida TaxID=1433469 RepID=A0A9N9ARV6_9GLOM|nr:5743_t:CDS:2 [Cetraspora pellucida]
MEENGFLPTVHFRPKKSFPELSEHTSSCSANRRTRPYPSSWQQKNKNQLYGKYTKWNQTNSHEEPNDDTQEYERPAKRLSLSNPTAYKWNQYQQNAEDNGIGNSNLSDDNPKGQFQRSMSSFMFGSKSVESSSSAMKKFIPYDLQEDSTLSQPGDRGGFQRSLDGSLFGMRSIERSNQTSSMECNTLRKVQAETRRNDLVVKIAGPIEFLPSDYRNNIRTLATRHSLAKFNDVTLNNVMKSYRNRNSSGSNPFEPLKDIEITKEEWVSTMRTLDLLDCSRNTMKALQQWQDIKIKIPITVGKIIKLDSNKKVATIADYTGKIQAIIHEKVLRVHSQQFQLGAIIVLKNVGVATKGVAILRSIGNTYLNITLSNVCLISMPEQSNNLESTLSSPESHAISVDLTYRYNEGVDSKSVNQTNVCYTGSSDNDLTTNNESSECVISTNINEPQVKVTSMSNDPEINSFMGSNMEDPEDISWMLDDLEEVVLVDY